MTTERETTQKKIYVTSGHDNNLVQKGEETTATKEDNILVSRMNSAVSQPEENTEEKSPKSSHREYDSCGVNQNGGLINNGVINNIFHGDASVNATQNNGLTNVTIDSDSGPPSGLENVDHSEGNDSEQEVAVEQETGNTIMPQADTQENDYDHFGQGAGKNTFLSNETEMKYSDLK